MAANPIKAALKKRPVLLNGWISLGSPLVVEMLGGTGWDLVTIDLQHGIGGDAEMNACLTAARAAGLPALVRVAHNEVGRITRVLDAGADGVICPMINNRKEAEALVLAAKYPPVGGRSFGAYRAGFLTGGDYFAEANGATICCAQIETAEAMENLDAILSTPGIDMILVGPFDLSISLSGGKMPDTGSPASAKAHDRILERCRHHKVIPAMYCAGPDAAAPLIAKGWQMVTLGCDAEWLLEGAGRMLAGLKHKLAKS